MKSDVDVGRRAGKDRGAEENVSVPQSLHYCTKYSFTSTQKSVSHNDQNVGSTDQNVGSTLNLHRIQICVIMTHVI